MPTTLYRVWLDYLAGRAKKRAETRKPSVQYEGKEGVSLWRADLRLKAKHTQRSQARPVTITWKRPSEEGPWTEAPHRGTRTRAYLYTIDWAVELERNSRSPGFSPGSTHTSPLPQYNTHVPWGVGPWRLYILTCSFDIASRLTCQRPRHCADVQLSQRGWVSSVIRSGLKDKADHSPAEWICRVFSIYKPVSSLVKWENRNRNHITQSQI